MTLAVTKGGSKEEDAKQRIYNFFPIKKMITVRIKTDRKHVYILAGVESNEFNQFASVENAVISLLCPNPYFISVVEQEVIIDGDAAVPIFEFPFENASLTEDLLEFGEILTIPTADVVYSGEVETGVLIFLSMFDYVHDVTIINTNGSQVMNLDFTGAETYFGGPVEAGDQVFINTKVGEKAIYFVRDNVFYNMINGVDIDSDWIMLNPGSNVISVSADIGQDQIETQILYRALSEGV
jgi:hypothetical protein